MAFDMSSLLGGLGQAFSQQEGYDYMQPTNSVSGLDVIATPAARSVVPTSSVQPAAPSNGAVNSAFNAYDNRAVAQAMQQIQKGEPQHIGMFGVRGTLRDVLGTIGDAFLIRDGREPIYRDKRNQENIADAMAGFAQDPEHAAGRVAAVAAPGAIQAAEKINEDYQTERLRQATIDQNNWYRQQTVEGREQQRLQNMMPYAAQIASTAKDVNDYKARVGQIDAMLAKRFGNDKDGNPKYDHTDIGLPDAELWTPGSTSTAGMTSAQVARNDTSRASIQERADAAANRNKIAQQNADTNAARFRATPHNPSLSQTDAAIINKARTQGVQSLSPAELDRYNNKLVNAPRGAASAVLPPGLRPGSASGPQPARPVPTEADRAYARAHPEARQAFQQHFGVTP